MHRRSGGHLDGFEIELAALAPAAEYNREQADSLLERLPRGSLRPFFFLRQAIFLLQRPEPADLLVDRQQLSAQLLEAMKRGHFPLRLASFRLIRKRLANRLPVHTMSETALGTVPPSLGRAQ